MCRVIVTALVPCPMFALPGYTSSAVSQARGQGQLCSGPQVAELNQDSPGRQGQGF